MKYHLLLLALLFASTTATAETYRWEDKQGLHFTDNLASVPKKFRAKALAESAADGVPPAAQDGERQAPVTTAGSKARQAGSSNYCSEFSSYSIEEYASLRDEHNKWVMTCRSMKKRLTNYSQDSTEWKNFQACLDAETKAAAAQSRYYSCGRSVGKVPLPASW